MFGRLFRRSARDAGKSNSNAPSALKSFLPTRKAVVEGHKPWGVRMAEERAQRKQSLYKARRLRETRVPVPCVKQQCLCRCGTEMLVPKGTLRFFAGRDHRASYRRAHGAINYAKFKRA